MVTSRTVAVIKRIRRTELEFDRHRDGCYGDSTHCWYPFRFLTAFESMCSSAEYPFRLDIIPDLKVVRNYALY